MSAYTPSVNKDPVLAAFGTHAAAEASVRAFSLAGFEMKNLSLVG